jgi:low affinity Fe/Cu permease
MHSSSCVAPDEAGRHMRSTTEPYREYRGTEVFRRIATKTAHSVGHPLTFIAALAVVVIWAFSGHFFHYSDTWQLVINTGTTIVTFLMVFLIQNTQNRDSHALHLKLDELIRANQNARNRMIMLEELSDEELNELQEEFNRKACERVEARRKGQNLKNRAEGSHRAGHRRRRRHGGREGDHRA